MYTVVWLALSYGAVMNGNSQFSSNEYYKVITMGPSGVGKSSLINFMLNDGTEVAKEGLFESLTSNVTFYFIEDFNLDLGDSPGLVDTRGYSNEEISQLIKSSIIEQSNYVISGVLLMFDAANLRQFLESCVESVVKIFGEQVLSKIIFVFNRNESKDIDDNFKQELNRFVLKILSPIYSEYGYQRINIKQRMIFIDTKGDFNKYSNKLYNKVSTYFNGNGIDIVEQDKKLQTEIEKYYQMELKDTINYDTKTWSYKCHCYKDCDRIGPIKMNCVSICSTCTKSETYLKYDRQYLKEKSYKKVSSFIQKKVYAALRNRNNNDHKYEL